ncbi:hypothetical protein B0J13DRAFT_622983 [Dactylonectria estremocensis]|uniref:Uncharacterized protein n=1 Tax=Dactylonectria estremocensis TaxID=1079267 RepID=A0A9P9J6H4_9HYPO|nr:hypothetical protein B0J13DRAFT_622983 [Dactylonectria estremocensis]
MRVTSTEDTGLSESTYELITSTDTESQDDNYTESMGESVGSLDFHRLDDVHSLAGTEHTYDDESVAGDLESHLNIIPSNDNDEHDTAILDPTSRAHQDGESASTDGSDTESESEDDARSRSSLEYTQQSLKTPSIPTPEASRIVDRPADLVDANEDEDNASIRTSVVTWFSKWYKAVRYRDNQAWSSLVRTANSALPGILCALIVALVIAAVQPRDLHIPAAMPALTTPHPTPSLASSTSQTTSTRLVPTTTTETAGLVPLENALPNDWLFAGKKPDLAVFKQHGQFLVRMPSDVKEAWLTKKCLTFSATRGEDSVPITASSVDDGMLIKFPYEESYGTVKVDIAASCRPKIRKAFRVTFDKGIMEGALEITKHLAQDLTELVPAAAQEAERCFGEAKRSLESASDNVLTVSDSLLKDLSTRFHNAHYSLAFIKKEARERIQSAKIEMSKKLGGIADQITERLPKPRDIQDQAQLNLLDAQISAKLWWLKMIGTKDQHDQYQHKAKGFMAQKKADASEARKMRRHMTDDKTDVRSGLWNKVFKGPRCANKLGKGKRGMQQCNFVV